MTADDHGARLGTWLELIRRARIHKDLKYAALIFASYANGDGTRILCSRARFTVDLDVDQRTAERRIDWLRDAGLIELVKRGNRRRGLSDEYRLTLIPDHTEKFLDAPNPDEYRKQIGQQAETNRRLSAEKYRRKKARDEAKEAEKNRQQEASSTDSTSDGRRAVDNSGGGLVGAGSSTDSTSDGRSSFLPTDPAVSTDKPNSLTCEDVMHTSHDYTLHGQDNLPCGADTARSPSYRPHAGEAATNPIHRTGMDADTARRYREAYAALATLQDLGLDLQAAVRAEFGDLPNHQVVIKAAERFAHRRTG